MHFILSCCALQFYLFIYRKNLELSDFDWIFPHLDRLDLLVAAVPGDEPAVFPSRNQRAISQHAQGKDAALVSSLDDMTDAISACVTEMGRDGWEVSVGQT